MEGGVMAKYSHDTEATADIEPLDNLRGDHHTDEPMRREDEEIGDKLSWYMGDLFIDSHRHSPREQWQRVARALRIHGLRIVNRRSHERM
jgi:hypothetical protein